MRLVVPGKLVIAGEYAVLEAGQPGIAVAVDHPLEAVIEPSFRSQVTIEALGLKAIEPGSGLLLERAPFVAGAISRTAHYLEQRGIQPMPFQLTLTGAATKLGLGGSAQSTVAATAALLAYCGCFEQERLYKLSALSHAHVQGAGSGLDVAAIVYGGWVSYVSPGQHRLVSGELEDDWGPWAVDRIDVAWPLLIGWTGQASSTPSFIRAVESHDLETFWSQSRDAVENLGYALSQGNFSHARQALEDARCLLKNLGESLGIAIETPLLAQLAKVAWDCGGAGKLSGAGGGDCGIALVANQDQAACIHAGWLSSGIEPLDLAVDQLGARIVGS